MSPEDLGLDPKTTWFSHNCFYVYLLYRREELVYVGKGSSIRLWESVEEHYADDWEIICITSFENYAYLVERSLIRLVGLENLDNLRSGGPGGEGHRGWKQTKEAVERWKIAITKFYASDEGKLSVELRSLFMREIWRDPIQRGVWIGRMRSHAVTGEDHPLHGRVLTKEHRDKLTESGKARFGTPKARSKMRETSLRVQSCPNLQNRIRESCKSWWNTPAGLIQRERCRQRMLGTKRSRATEAVDE